MLVPHRHPWTSTNPCQHHLLSRQSVSLWSPPLRALHSWSPAPGRPCRHVVVCSTRADGTPTSTHVRPQPVIILVNPIMAENIGSAARAMMNFGLVEMRLVAPKDGWTPGFVPLVAAATAARAGSVVKSAALYGTTEEAVADLHLVYAATARSRAMNKPVVFSRDLYQDITLDAPRSHHHTSQTPQGQGHVPHVSSDGQRIGILFGMEKSGLSNADVILANKVVTVDANDEYPVLNLAQAVNVIAYELYQGHQRQLAVMAENAVDSVAPAAPQGKGLPADLNPQQLATRGEVQTFLTTLFSVLEDRSFFWSDAAKRQGVEAHVHNLMGRVQALSFQDLNLLYGMLSKLKSKKD